MWSCGSPHSPPRSRGSVFLQPIWQRRTWHPGLPGCSETLPSGTGPRRPKNGSHAEIGASPQRDQAVPGRQWKAGEAEDAHVSGGPGGNAENLEPDTWWERFQNAVGSGNPLLFRLYEGRRADNTVRVAI